jgi:hypothetical protein
MLPLPFQLSVHQHHLVLHALAGNVEQLLQPFHLPPAQCRCQQSAESFTKGIFLFSGQISKRAENQTALLFPSSQVS